MNRDSNSSIIPKIIIFLGTLSALGIILLFFRPRPEVQVKKDVSTPQKLFTQVILSAHDSILKIWEEGDKLIPKEGLSCPSEMILQNGIGRSFYKCQPHLWQCYWEGGVQSDPRIKIDLYGQTYHVKAVPSFNPIKEFSLASRYYQAFKRKDPGIDLLTGYVVEFEVQEIPGLTQAMALTDTCRDTYLPEGIYPYGKPKKKNDEGFIWDNFDRNIFLDKFYVTVQRVNEWRVLTGDFTKIEQDKKNWPYPAYLNAEEQTKYCAFYGKRVLEAKLFDAASMTPADLKNPTPTKVFRPQTPWQRDLSKSFLGMSRINPDYQLTPLDCQLAQVEGCSKKLFSTDSATWMGFHHTLGFEPEALRNEIEPNLNLKMSSRHLPPQSEWHELGKLSHWKGLVEDKEKKGVAFRCYEEVSP